MAGIRLTDPRTVDQRIARTCEVIELARDLGVGVVTASTGALTHPESGEPSPHAIEALHRIGEFADLLGVVFALRPSHDRNDRLARVLDELRCPSIGVCLDPAAIVMTGGDPLAGFEYLADGVRLVHVRDATAGGGDQEGHETALGEGDVDLVGLVSVLDVADYPGPYILRRKDSRDPAGDLAQARDVFARLLPG